MRTHIVSARALIVASLFLAPFVAWASIYAPGATLNPDCGPNDANCGVSTTVGSIIPGTAGQVPYYAADGNALSASPGVTILPSGNIGIGTANPGNKLSVVGDVNLNTTSSQAFNIQDQFLSNYLTVSTASTTGDILDVASSTGTVLFEVTQGGNVGIGTVTPAGLLDISGNSALTTLNNFDGARAVSVINSNATNGNASGFDFRTVDTNGALITGAKIMGVYTDHTAGAAFGDLAFLARNAGSIGEVMRVTGAGKVGIGTTSPFSFLTIVNSATTPINTPLLNIASTTAGTSTTTLMIILPSGNAGIGTSSPPQKLTVAGVIRQTGCITAGTLSANTAGDIICTPSSLRFKDDVTGIGAGLADIVALRPVSFEYKPELDLGSGTHFGLIAEEVASVTPEFATYDATGAPYGLDTNAILAAVVNAIKELDVRVNGGVATVPSSLQSLATSIGQTSSLAIDDILSRVSTWLSDANNGIGDLFANRVQTNELCVGTECVNESQLAQILTNNPVVSVPTAPETTTTVTEATTTPEETTPLLPNTGSVAKFTRTLDLGSSGPDVVALQLFLMQKGFLFLPPDLAPGYFGDLTRSAVMAYQRSVGLQPVGAVGPATRAMLNGELSR